MDEDNDLFRLTPGPSNSRKDPVPKRLQNRPNRLQSHVKTRSRPSNHLSSTKFQPRNFHPLWSVFHPDQSHKPTEHRITTQNKAPFSQQQTSSFNSKRIYNNTDRKNFSTNIQRYPSNKGNGKKTITRTRRQQLQEAHKMMDEGCNELEELATSDANDILTNKNDKKNALFHLLKSPIDNPDGFALILELLSKICESSFDQLKLNILLDICNSEFVTSLRNYLTDLPYTERKSENNKYWENEIEFWKNFIRFCECIILISPQTALSKCRSLIEGTSRFCLEELKTRHNFVLPDEYKLKLDELCEKLIAHEKTKERKRTNLAEEQDPPDNFRELSVLPSREDIMEDRPYLRANLIKGKYRDVEHYLDVQFRLLREDCFGPLREGIRQFLQDPSKRKYDNIRVFHNVKFVGSYVSPHKVGFYVEFDDYTKKRLHNINWSHSKRFIFGSLVLFTKDNYKSFLVATIIDRDLKDLVNGKVPVSLVDNNVDVLLLKDTYTMIESEVYFEPYYHVLKALQDPTFPQHIAMKKYIVDVDFEPSPPRYLKKETKYAITLPHDDVATFNVLDLESWPSADDIQLDESQFEAYKTALTHEFAVIQGPPGTGKTYLGIKVAETLLNKLSKSGCLLLLVCYTNHALDQFLEALIKVTHSIVRIGGRSRNEALEEFTLNKMRNNLSMSSESEHQLYKEQKDKLKSSIIQLKRSQKDLDSINNDIISYTCLRKYVPDCQVVEDSYNAIIKKNQDPLYYWLFENLTYDFNERILFKDNKTEEQLEDANDKRNTVILDELEIDETHNSNEIVTVFSLQKVEHTLSDMINKYHSENDLEKKTNLHRNIILQRTKIRLFKQMKERYLQGTRVIPINCGEDVRSLPLIERWMLYFSWSQLVFDIFKERIIPLQETVTKNNDAYEESRMLLDLSLLKNVEVVGMTTSGAARLRKLLKSLAPPIVIVEEAAEVLEQHIITSLTNKCEHLILIGDHQQLRPSASHLRLARHFQLEVSLFERMVLNGVLSRRLRVQHRMRPQLSALIAPHIYPDLLDHPSVAHFPDVRGLTRNLFFFTHDYREEVVDDSSSRTNQKEADMTLSLANYIMQQGYEPEDVTILAAYSGQMFYMRKQRHLYSHLSQNKITVVDNYQGEESKIILLSLVRNNVLNKIGFLGIENRICVGLSRAKEGFYIFGNIDILKANSSLWVNIAETLEGQDALGRNIKLKCQNHVDQITTICSVDDFSKVPDGGCLLKCNHILSCLHSCPRQCHSYDREHDKIKCSLKCERIICKLQHVCPLKCMKKCEPCKIMVMKTLPCGHDMEVFCHLHPRSIEIQCLTEVPVKLPLCGHEVNKSCYEQTSKVKCLVRCGMQVERCGHTCVRFCHVGVDPGHKKYTCYKPCGKAKKGCSMELEGDRHQCRKKCYEECDECNVKVVKARSQCKHKERVPCSRSADERPCLDKCARALACGHFCTRKCSEPCGDCRVKVKKEIPECGHEVVVECDKAASRELCTQACARELACGHRCRQPCREECSPAACTELLPALYDSPCGHRVQLPCNIASAQSGPPEDAVVVRQCRAACGAQLSCGHACGGDCARCHRGRLHAPCARRCQLPYICGHRCNEPCNQLCPPCNKDCQMKCAHARCPRSCGAPCVPCQEPCGRACPHGRCVRRCGAACSRGACAERCSLLLACGHRCRGLCGERCPDICNTCRPDDLPVDLLADQFDDHARFIILEDCGHIMEFENMERLMNSVSESVSLRACPFCRKPIINTPRYKDLVKYRFKTDIIPIKKRVYGNIQKNLETKKELLSKMTTFKDVHAEIYEDIQYSDWKKAFDKLFCLVNKNYSKNKKYPNMIQLNMYFVYLDILEILSGILEQFKTAESTELQSELADKNSMICCVLLNNSQKISEQQQMDIGNEMKRMDSIVMLSKLLSQESYITSKDQPNIMQALETVKREVLGYGIYKENSALDALKNFQDIIKASNIVTKVERELIVKAVGATAGQWYKCPNGHLYSIDSCGGEMEMSKCVECNEPIGGQNHRA